MINDKSTLSLFVARVLTDHTNDSSAPYDLAFNTHLLD